LTYLDASISDFEVSRPADHKEFFIEAISKLLSYFGVLNSFIRDASDSWLKVKFSGDRIFRKKTNSGMNSIVSVKFGILNSMALTSSECYL
jgi:hypothetical protein